MQLDAPPSLIDSLTLGCRARTAAVLLACLLAVGCGGNKGNPGNNKDAGDVGADGSQPDGSLPPDTDIADVGRDTEGPGGPTDTGGPVPDGNDMTVPAPEIWRLAPGSDTWKSFDMAGRPSRWAPTSEIVAAFDIEHSNNAYVFTKSGVHLLRLEPTAWKDAQPFDSVAAGLSDVEVLAAFSDPEDAPDDRITILGRQGGSAKLWSGQYDIDDESFSGFEMPESVDWSSANAPMPQAVVAAWRDNDDERDWLSGKPPCDNAPDDEFGAVVGYLTGASVHFNDPWYCTDHFTSTPLEQSPVNMSGFPPVDQIGAAFWHADALYLIAKD